MIFSPNRATLVIRYGTYSKQIKLIPITSEGFHASIPLSGLAMAFSPDSKIFAGSKNNTIELWSVSDEKRIKVFQEDSNEIGGIAFSPDGTILAAALDNGTISLRNVNLASLLNTPTPELTPENSVPKILESHTGAIISIAFSPDGRLIVSSSNDGTIRLWGVAP